MEVTKWLKPSGRCRVPDDCLLENRRALLVGRDALRAALAQFNRRNQRC
jgi:hypothetical protein